MPEQIGLQAVLEMSQFNAGVTTYLNATAKMDATTEKATKTTKSFGDTIGGRVLIGALEQAGRGIMGLVQQIPQMAAEMYQLGAQVEATQYRFEAFAGGPEESAKYLEAFTRAANGSIDRMSAMQGASKLLQMGLVGNSDEMEMMAKIAVKLGDQTAAAGDRVNDFALLLANQSVMRLDNFGISSGRVRKRIEELQAATKDLSREEAFKIAVMEEGAQSLERLGDTTQLATTKVGNITAALANLKQTAGTMFLDLANSLNIFGVTLGDIPDAIGWSERALEAWGAAQKVFWENGIMPGISGAIAAFKEFDNTMKQSDPALNEIKVATEDLRYQHVTMSRDLGNSSEAMNQYTKAVEDAAKASDDAALKLYEEENAFNGVSYASEATKRYLKNQIVPQDALMKKVLEVAASIEKENQAMLDTQRTLTDLSISYTDFGRDVEETRTEYAQSIEDIELEHQENLAELTKKGQAWRKQIDLEAENEKLATLQQKLDLALLQQSEFTDKTKESTRVAKQQQIAALQAQIAEESALIASANNGYIVMQGANVTEDLALENERYAEKLRLAQEAYALEQEEQRRHLGQMILNSFDAWVSINGGVSKETETMRAKLAEEYGLMESGSSEFVGSMWTMFDEWGKDMGGTTEALINGLNTAANSAYGLGTAIENLPTEKTISVNYKVTGPAPEAESHPEYVPHTGGSGDYGGGNSWIC